MRSQSPSHTLARVDPPQVCFPVLGSVEGEAVQEGDTSALQDEADALALQLASTLCSPEGMQRLRMNAKLSREPEAVSLMGTLTAAVGRYNTLVDSNNGGWDEGGHSEGRPKRQRNI